jgi:hypothetical protein
MLTGYEVLDSSSIGYSSNPVLPRQPGPDTWPIVAMSYIYIRKDLTYLKNPASQTLLKAFLEALYTDSFITVCEEEYGFHRVTGSLREKALTAISELVVSSGAPEWTFENDTIAREGQGDFVISVKRDSYSGVAQASASSAIDSLSAQLEELRASYAALEIELTSHGNASTGSAAMGVEEDSQVNVAMGLAAASFALWMLTIIGVLVKFVLKI